jgi:sugar O-acyltransferase (sialic acid O-acetyltransferase NeuD family)
VKAKAKQITKSPRQLLILGTGTFAEEIADVVSEIPGVIVTGFVENMDRRLCEKKLGNLPIFWVDQLSHISKDHEVICGLGTTHRYRYINQVRKYNVTFVTLVHPSSRISQKSSMGEGTFISSGATIAAYTKLGRHVNVNRGVLIGHHTHIGSFVTIGPGANIAGNSRIGDRTYIGMGALVLDHISVGSHSIVGAGAVVTKNVPDNVQVVGIPAKIVKQNIDGK